ncbi:MAG: AsnC family transcriptional regulator [Gammaproteobacteria bacterium]
MDTLDRAILNTLQDGFPVCERPFAVVAARLGTSEGILIERLEALLRVGFLSRFGPLYHAERLGGALLLAAMRVPTADLERIAALVNRFPEVAHNYARDHDLNLWFVIATEHPERVPAIVAEIESLTGLKVYPFPKREEYFLGLRLEV